MAVTHPKGGNIFWTCAKGSIIEEKEDCEAIGLRGFDYKLFEEDEGGGFNRYYTGILICSN